MTAVAIAPVQSQSHPEELPRAPDTAATCIPAWVPFGGQDEIESNLSSAAFGSDGFLYLGGSTGLHRVEGKRVRSWFPDPNDPSAMRPGAITALVAHGEAIWIGTSLGLFRFTPKTGSFERVPLTDAFPSDPRIQSLRLIDETLYIGTIGEDAFALDPDSPDTVRAIKLANASADPTVFDFAKFENKIVIATREGLEVLAPDGTIASLDGMLAPRGAEALALGPRGKLWVGAEDGLYTVSSLAPLSFESATRETYPSLPDSAIDALALDGEGRMWIGGEGGLARWDTGKRAPVNCRRDSFGNPDRRVAITFLTTDMANTLIMGTRGSQVKLARLNTGIRRIATGDPRYSNLPRTSIWSTLISADGRLFLGTTAGLFRETRAGSDQFEKLHAGALENRHVTALYEAPDGDLWIGTNRGVFVSTNEGISLVPMLTNKDGMNGHETVYKIAAHGQKLLMASRDGLIILDRASRQVTGLIHDDERDKPINGAPTTLLERARFWHTSSANGHAFATGSAYIYRIDPETGRVLASADKARASGAFTPGRIHATIAREDGAVIIGTDNGLALTNLDFDEFEFVDRLQGKRLGAVANLLHGVDGDVWLSTGELGLLRHQWKQDQWSAYTVEDGLHMAVTTQGALSVSGTGTIVNASGFGASVIPRLAQSRKSVEGFTLAAYNSKDKQPVLSGASITLEPGERQLSFDFAVPQLLEDDRYWVQYRFARAGGPARTETVDLNRPLSLQYLEPGDYLFTGQLVSASGPVSEPLQFDVFVLAHWWERTSTYMALMALVAIGLGAVFMYRTRSIERKVQIIADERRRIAQELHDSSLQDLFGAQMLGRSLHVDGTQDGAEGQKDQVLDLIKSATASMRKSVMTLREDPDTPALSKAIGDFEPPAALSRDIAIDYSEDGKKWPVGKHRRFFVARIAQEAINNAAKHARASKITTKIDWSFWNLTLEVSDDGSGFDPSSPDYRAGHGREAMKCMADAVSGTLETVSAPGEGTKVRLKVPRFAL